MVCVLSQVTHNCRVFMMAFGSAEIREARDSGEGLSLSETRTEARKTT